MLLSRVPDTAAPDVPTEMGAAEAAVMRSALAAAAKVIVSAFMEILQLIVSVTQLARGPMVPWNISMRAGNLHHCRYGLSRTERMPQVRAKLRGPSAPGIRCALFDLALNCRDNLGGRTARRSRSLSLEMARLRASGSPDHPSR